MNIDIKDKITLDDNNAYIVVSKVNYKNLIFYYLIDVNNNENIKFCYENIVDNCLIENMDEDLNQILLPLFFENAIKHVDNVNFEGQE